MKTLRILLGVLFVLMAGIQPVVAETRSISPQAVDAGQWQCYNDGSIDPCHRTLNAIAMVSATDGWAVGDGGLILRWNGTAWASVDSPTSNKLTSIAMASATDGWAVGASGMILRWNGSSWAVYPSILTTADLFSLALVSANDIWVTSGWYLYHWNGFNWSQIYSSSQYLNAVSMASSTDGWAVGYSGYMLRYSSGAWGPYTGPTSEALASVAMISTTDGWANGYNGTVLRWNGSQWLVTTNPANNSFANFWGLTGYASDNVWMVGFDNGSIVLYHWNGVNWSNKISNSDGRSYQDLAFIPGTAGVQAWAVGSATTVMLYSGVGWTAVNVPYGKPLQAFAPFSPKNIWLLGSGFPITRSDIWHWDGAAWSLAVSTVDIRSVDYWPVAGGYDAWGVGGGGEIRHWDSNAWTVLTPSPVDFSVTLESIDMIGPGEGWAVGNGYDFTTHSYHGFILRLQGGAWSVFSGPPETLYAVGMASTIDGWIVGTNGILYRWNGTDWYGVSSPVSDTLYSVVMTSASEGWAAGSSGRILRWNGSSWNAFTSPTNSILYEIAFWSSSNGWIAGSGGVFHWDGVNWSSAGAPAGLSYLGLGLAAYNDVWASTSTGSILHFVGPAAQQTTNYLSGAPGSHFALSAANFPPDATAAISVNGRSLGTVPTGSSGNFSFDLDTSGNNEGEYWVRVTVGSEAETWSRFILGNSEPLRAQEVFAPSFTVPTGIAYTQSVFIPAVRR